MGNTHRLGDHVPPEVGVRSLDGRDVGKGAAVAHHKVRGGEGAENDKTGVQGVFCLGCIIGTKSKLGQCGRKGQTEQTQGTEKVPNFFKVWSMVRTHWFEMPVGKLALLEF